MAGKREASEIHIGGDSGWNYQHFIASLIPPFLSHNKSNPLANPKLFLVFYPQISIQSDSPLSTTITPQDSTISCLAYYGRFSSGNPASIIAALASIKK